MCKGNRIRFTRSDLTNSSRWSTPVGSVSFVWDCGRSVKVLIDDDIKGVFQDRQSAVDYVNQLIIRTI